MENQNYPFRMHKELKARLKYTVSNKNDYDDDDDDNSNDKFI